MARRKKLYEGKAKIIYEDAASTAMAMAYLQKSEKQELQYYLKALYFSEKNKASVLSEAVAISNAQNFAGIPDSIIQEDTNYKIVISAVENRILETRNRSVLLKLNDLLFELNEKYRFFSSNLEKKYPKYFEAKYNKSNIDFTEIQKTLDDSTAIISYFLGNNNLLIFTVTKDKIEATEKNIEKDFAKKINKLIKATITGTSKGFKAYLKLSNYFYDVLIPKSIPTNISKLVILPDGAINLIPFELLTYEKYSGKLKHFNEYPFLIKKYMCSYFFSGDLYFKSLKYRSNNHQNSWLGIAPVFKDINSRKINNVYVNELPGTETEINNIAEVIRKDSLNKVSILLNNEATETNLKNLDLGNYKYVHIATHGTVNIDNPAFSGLLLFPEKEPDDGVLYASEIYNLKLNSDLVVLSACETGVGKVSKSEGIIGLSRSLLYAGAKNIIVSMWKVADNSTAQLMLDFYTNLISKKQSFRRALHNAKLKMVNSKNNFAHPYFWSPFVLIGK